MKKEKKPIGCVIGSIGFILLLAFGIIFIFKRDLPFWPLLISLIMIIIGMVNFQTISNKEEKASLKKQGINPKNFIFAGTYTCGHPSINNPVKNIKILLRDFKIQLFELNNISGKTEMLGEIPVKDVENITIDDATTISNRVGVKRMLLVGLFAFAWKKKRINEVAYLVIEWNKGKFKNETIFEFEGKGSVMIANTLRNKLINFCED